MNQFARARTLGELRAYVGSRWGTIVAPRADGLPNRIVIGIPLGLLALIFIALVALGVTGSSTGAVHSQIQREPDPALISGEPQGIRSDEWFVQTSWVISQVEQGLPIRNESFPGGMDATVQNDLPNSDWSTAFRPHLLGFFVLPLDQAMAFKWWFPAFALIGAAYLFVVSFLPRRPITGALLAVGFFFSPFFQWWYLSLTLYPAVWALLVGATVVWCLRAQSRTGPWVLAALSGYVSVTLGMGIYVPFIVPAAVVVLGFAFGALLTRDFGPPRIGSKLKRIVPLILAAAAAGIVLGIWLVTRWPTIVGFTSTVYPGERLQSTGGGGSQQLAQLLSGPLSKIFGGTEGYPLASNSSEVSTFLLPGLFLVVTAVWLAVSRRQHRKSVDWLTLGVLSSGVVMVAFLFFPGWDVIAHATFIDRTTYSRIRMGFGLLSFILVVLVARGFDERRHGAGRGSRWIAACAPLLVLGSVAFVLWQIDEIVPLTEFIALVGRREMLWGAFVALLFVCAVWFFARDRVLWGALALLVVSVVNAGGVNPLYRGVLDLRETSTVERIQHLNEDDPGAWVGINSSLLPTMMLVESGVTTYNGVQGAPSTEMWEAIDPESAYEEAWNRLATVSWLPGEGDPAPRNPVPDQIQVTFDSCATFAQENVTWVLSEVALDQSCVEFIESIEEGPTTMRIYEVVPEA